MIGRIIITGKSNLGISEPAAMTIDTTSNSGEWSGLSPFKLRGIKALVMENEWQFSKVYPEHAFPDGTPKMEWYVWRRDGFADPMPHRYPMGKGKRPLYSLKSAVEKEPRRLGYIAARKAIYAPLYAMMVQKTDSFKSLRKLVNSGTTVALRDYDGYDHEALGMSLTDVQNNTEHKMGHAFVLKMILTDDPAMKEWESYP